MRADPRDSYESRITNYEIRSALNSLLQGSGLSTWDSSLQQLIGSHCNVLHPLGDTNVSAVSPDTVARQSHAI